MGGSEVCLSPGGLTHTRRTQPAGASLLLVCPTHPETTTPPAVSKLWGTKNVRLCLKCILERVVSLRVTGILNHEPHFCDANPLYFIAIRILRQQLETFSMCMLTELA